MMKYNLGFVIYLAKCWDQRNLSLPPAKIILRKTHIYHYFHRLSLYKCKLHILNGFVTKVVQMKFTNKSDDYSMSTLSQHLILFRNKYMANITNRCFLYQRLPMDLLAGFPFKKKIILGNKKFNKHNLILCQVQQIHFLILTDASIDNKKTNKYYCFIAEVATSVGLPVCFYIVHQWLCLLLRQTLSLPLGKNTMTICDTQQGRTCTAENT